MSFVRLGLWIEGPPSFQLKGGGEGLKEELSEGAE